MLYLAAFIIGALCGAAGLAWLAAWAHDDGPPVSDFREHSMRNPF